MWRDGWWLCERGGGGQISESDIETGYLCMGWTGLGLLFCFVCLVWLFERREGMER